MFVLYIILAVLILLFMVLIHELGHYIIGRLLNFKITEFSIGFGKAIFSKTNKRGEKISLRIFPLGGYCAFAGEGDDENLDNSQEAGGIKTDENSANSKDKNIAKKIEIKESKLSQKVDDEHLQSKNKTKEKVEKAENCEEKNIAKNEGNSKNFGQKPVRNKKELLFNEQPAWKRILVFLAGVTFNFVTAIIFSLILLCSIGYDIPQVTKYDPLAKHVASETYEYNHDASETSLQEGDVIYSINGRKIDFAYGNTFEEIIKIEQAKLIAWVKENKDADFSQYPAMNFVVARNGERIEVPVSFFKIVQEKTTTDESGQQITKTETAYSLGIYAKAYRHSFLEALQRAIPFSFGLAWVVLKSLWLLITFQLGVEAIGGPITTITTIATVTQASAANLLVLIPLISANLAIFNLLPIPALDGSHVLFTTIEWIRKKPINRKIENMIHTIGLAVLFGLVILVDILHFLL